MHAIIACATIAWSRQSIEVPASWPSPPTDAAVFDRASERAIATLRANNVEVVVVDTGAQARDAVLERVPDGSEVLVGKSKTLEDIGVIDALLEEGRFDFVRSRLRAMDRATEGREMRAIRR